jgi:lipopolysaccharide transport system ATP-binding protein
MPPAIRVESLSKSYRISHTAQRNTYRTLSEDLVEMATAPLKRWRRHRANGLTEEFWALKDVDFEVQPGEVVGVIGRNGAGKSTLLKILSRITEPTEGRVRLRGRVGSLLEVGTGFHPELTGRENVYLNGSILGMSRKEIDRRFDEIVAFAEVERFLDTPVKRYSSGMYVRLAFAVAAHLEPEILIVDEVLAVGDAAFQEKCLGQMHRNALQGRTVLFVSHNMASIRQLCTRTVFLKAGCVVADGPVGEVVGDYYKDARAAQTDSLREWADRDPQATGQARIVRFDINVTNGESPDCTRLAEPIQMSMDVEFYESIPNPTFGVLVSSITGEALLDLRSIHSSMHVNLGRGIIRVTVTVPSLGLYPGEYLLSPWVADHSMKKNLDWAKNVRVLLVIPPYECSSDLQRSSSWGKYWVPSEWSFRPIKSEA